MCVTIRQSLFRTGSSWQHFSFYCWGTNLVLHTSRLHTWHFEETPAIPKKLYTMDSTLVDRKLKKWQLHWVTFNNTIMESMYLCPVQSMRMNCSFTIFSYRVNNGNSWILPQQKMMIMHTSSGKIVMTFCDCMLIFPEHGKSLYRIMKKFHINWDEPFS